MSVCASGELSSAGLQRCLGAGGLQRDQDQRGEEETDRLHSSCGTATGGGGGALQRAGAAAADQPLQDLVSGENVFILKRQENASSLSLFGRDVRMKEQTRGRVAS